MISYEQALTQSQRARHLLEIAYQQQQANQNNQALLILACELFQEIVDSEHELADVYLGLASLSFANGDPAYALRLLQNAEQLEPFNLEIAHLRKCFQSPIVEQQSAIPGLEVLTPWSEKASNKTMTASERMLGELHGTFQTEAALGSLIQDGLGHSLNQTDLSFLYLLLSQPFEKTQASDLKKLSQILGAVDPKYSRSIKLFVKDLKAAASKSN